MNKKNIKKNDYREEVRILFGKISGPGVVGLIPNEDNKTPGCQNSAVATINTSTYSPDLVIVSPEMAS